MHVGLTTRDYILQLHSTLTQAALPACVLAFFRDGRVTEPQAVGQQTRAPRVAVGDGHQGLGGPHGRRCVQFDWLLSGSLVENLDHCVLFYDLSVKVLDSEENRSCWDT